MAVHLSEGVEHHHAVVVPSISQQPLLAGEAEGDSEGPSEPQEPGVAPEPGTSPATEAPHHQPDCWDDCAPWLFKPQDWRNWVSFILVWGSTLGLIIFFIVWAFPRIVDSAFDPAVKAIDEHLTRVQIGVVVSSAVMILPITIVLSKEPFVWLAAVLFSFPEAFAMVMAGLIPGMAIPFFMTRLWFREKMLNWCQGYRYTAAVLLGIRKAGPFMTTIVLRLGPVPQPLVNYAMGVPEGVPFYKYITASTIGIIPETLVGVIFGRNIKGLSDMIQGEKLPASQIAVNLVSLAAAVILIVAGYIYAKRSLAQLEKEAEAEAELARQEAAAAAASQAGEPGAPDAGGAGAPADACVVVVQAVPLDGPIIAPTTPSMTRVHGAGSATLAGPGGAVLAVPGVAIPAGAGGAALAGPDGTILAGPDGAELAGQDGTLSQHSSVGVSVEYIAGGGAAGAGALGARAGSSGLGPSGLSRNSLQARAPSPGLLPLQQRGGRLSSSGHGGGGGGGNAAGEQAVQVAHGDDLMQGLHGGGGGLHGGDLMQEGMQQGSSGGAPGPHGGDALQNHPLYGTGPQLLPGHADMGAGAGDGAQRASRNSRALPPLPLASPRPQVELTHQAQS